MSTSRGVELGAQVGGIGNIHVGRIEQALASGLPLRIGVSKPAVDCLTHDGRNRDAALSRSLGDSAMALVVDQDL